jgi:cytosine permease
MTAKHSTLEDTEEQLDHILGDEHEHKPVPPTVRRSLFSNVMVWIGFPMIITGAMTGSILVLGMGFRRALTGHFAGGPGTNPDDVKFLDARVKELLAS